MLWCREEVFGHAINHRLWKCTLQIREDDDDEIIFWVNEERRTCAAECGDGGMDGANDCGKTERIAVDQRGKAGGRSISQARRCPQDTETSCVCALPVIATRENDSAQVAPTKSIFLIISLTEW